MGRKKQKAGASQAAAENPAANRRPGKAKSSGGGAPLPTTGLLLAAASGALVAAAFLLLFPGGGKTVVSTGGGGGGSINPTADDDAASSNGHLSPRRDSAAGDSISSGGRSGSPWSDDATSLRSSLENEAWDRLRAYDPLVRSGRLSEAEAGLRDAARLCPWLPGSYALLAHHLTEHGGGLTRQGRGRGVGEVFRLLRKAMRLQHALPGAAPEEGQGRRGTQTASELMKSLHKFPAFSKPFDGSTFPARLRHDREQLTLLGKRGKLPPSAVRRYVRGYERLLEKIPDDRLDKSIGLPEESWAATVGPVFNRALNVPDLGPLDGPALNHNLDFRDLEDRYLASEPHFIAFDDLLTDEALVALRTYYEEATVFWDDYPGYVGAHLFDGGFGNEVVAQLTEEIMDAFPRLICSHRLTQGWAFKYDTDIAQPVNAHADSAAVNFNVWLSPDENNLDPDGGGLVVYTAVPPEGTPFTVFNHIPLHSEAERMLRETDYANHTIPHRSNRAVVFQSDLFHESGKMKWAKGYEGRRINLTLLFGKMREKCAPPT